MARSSTSISRPGVTVSASSRRATRFTLASIVVLATLGLAGCKRGSDSLTPASASDRAEAANPAAGWSQPVAAGDEFAPCVTYRARIQGDYLVIEAKHDAGWHSYAIDNEVRAKKKLVGAKSLGVELPTSITVKGATVVGAWLQTPPEDFSDAEIQWYTWGFNGMATFAAKLHDVGTKPVVITIRGQVCDANTCRDVDVELPLDPVANRTAHALDVSALIPAQERAGKGK